VPPGLVSEVAAQAQAEADEAAAAAGGRVPRRRLRVLPPAFGVHVVLGLCLSSHLPYRDTVRSLVSGLDKTLKAAGWQAPSATAVTGCRRRLGARPFELLFARAASSLTAGAAEWSHLGGLLVTAWDGTMLKVSGSEANTAWFGRQQDGLPAARLVALAACGTRALLGAALGPMPDGERKLAAQLTGRLHAGMLLLTDRGFYSWGLWNACACTGAQLLWRVTGSMHLPVARRLPDGSYLTVIHDPAERRRRTARNGARRRRKSPLPPDASPLPGRKATVRVIEFTVTVTPGEGRPRTGRYRMITTLLDWQAFPAGDLAAAYARRWAVETAFRELKTCLRGPGRVLRPDTPELARQEIWAYLITYQAIRAVIARAAAGAGLAPARISFTAVRNSIRETITAARDDQAAALAAATGTALASPVPERPGRICARVRRQPDKPFPARGKNRRTPLSQHAAITVTLTPRGTATQIPPRQQKQPDKQARPAA
jgi:hypothetical protein